jgi:Domain of unknown function (DUF4402)
MNFSMKLAAATLAFVGVAGVASADNPGNPASATGTAAVEVVAPISVEEVDSLDFGAVTAPNTGSRTITIPASSDTRSSSDGGGLVGGTTAQRGEWDVDGGGTYTVTYAVGSPLMVGAGLTLQNLAVTPTSGSGTNQTAHVGGQLVITDAAEPGDYTGSYSFTAEYN